LVIQQFDESLSDEWDAFVSQCAVANMLHTRCFLSYHGNRFEDHSLIVRDDENEILAVFPAALCLTDDLTVVSHPGVTYGGILAKNCCRGELVVEVLQLICSYYKTLGLLKLQYKSTPFIYHSMPIQDDLYALFRLNALRYRCDLSATIDLEHRGRIGSRRKRGFKRAVKSGVKIETGLAYSEGLWHVLENNLKDKHSVRPVHRLDEIVLLHDRFPDQIQFVVALCNNKVEAGVVLFQSEMVSHSQYIASSNIGHSVNALDLVFEHCITQAKEHGKRYFDYGISNENGGRALNIGLYDFKMQYGAGSSVHEFYEVCLC